MIIAAAGSFVKGDLLTILVEQALEPAGGFWPAYVVNVLLAGDDWGTEAVAVAEAAAL